MSAHYGPFIKKLPLRFLKDNGLIEILNKMYKMGLFWFSYSASVFNYPFLFAGDDVRVVQTPPFADSVTEGDVRWDKG